MPTALSFNRTFGEIFRNRPEWPWGPPSLLYNGYRVFPGDRGSTVVKVLCHKLEGRWFDPS